MDWSKAKNILIMALLITNLVLGVAIYYGQSDDAGVDHEEIRTNTILLLAQHDIFVEEDQVSVRTERLPVLSVRYRIVDGDRSEAAIRESQIQLEKDATDHEYDQAAKTLMKTAGITGDYFWLEGITREEDQVIVTYGVEYDDYALDNSKLNVSFQNGIPTTMDHNWAEPISMGQNKKQVSTASTALIKFMTVMEKEALEQRPEFQREPIHIEDMGLVYWLEGYTDNDGVSEDTAVPYWCICYNQGQKAYIAAYEE